MTDLERVIQGLDCISGVGTCLQSEAFAGGICAYCMQEIAKKARQLLKEQQKLIDDMTKWRMDNGAFD